MSLLPNLEGCARRKFHNQIEMAHLILLLCFSLCKFIVNQRVKESILILVCNEEAYSLQRNCEPDGNLIQHIEGAGKPEERLFQLLLQAFSIALLTIILTNSIL